MLDDVVERFEGAAFALFGQFGRDVVREVGIGDFTAEAIGDGEVFFAIVVNIKKQTTPAPVRVVYACQAGDVAEGAIAIVALKGVSHHRLEVSVSHDGVIAAL